MGWVEELRGSVVGLDTAPLIYYIEKHPQYMDIIDPFFQASDKGEFLVVTSMLTLLEVLVMPLRRQNEQVVQQYHQHLFRTKGLSTVTISQEILERAAQIKAVHPKVRTPDAIQLATAIQAKAAFFLTNDAGLPDFPGMQVLLVSQLGS